MEWTEDTIVRLRELWDEGHSTAEIGRRLGFSKNAIVGKAHRLDLPARPSPIRREIPEPDAESGLRCDGTTLPPLPSDVIKPPEPKAGPLAPPLAVVAPVPLPRGTGVRPAATRPMAVTPPRAHVQPPRPYARIVTCCWPIGEPGTRSFHFCDDPSEPGKPYCADHAKLAYVKVRDRREDAA
jgi:GcrA cell cycle regulator